MSGWLERWRIARHAGKPAHEQRWIVLDAETGGLDPAKDPLLSIGAIAVHGTRIVMQDSFEAVLRQPQASSRPNILVHGIGEEAQRAGIDPTAAIQAFMRYIDDAPLLAFHAPFDRGFLRRAVSHYQGGRLANRWIDLAMLAPALHPAVQARTLDEWLEHFRIPPQQRHDASGDAFTSAMLFLKLLHDVAERDRTPLRLAWLAAQSRWLGSQR